MNREENSAHPARSWSRTGYGAVAGGLPALMRWRRTEAAALAPPKPSTAGGNHHQGGREARRETAHQRLNLLGAPIAGYQAIDPAM